MQLNRFFLIFLPGCLFLLSCRSGSTESGDPENTSRSDTGIILTAAQVKNGEIAFGSIGKKQLSFDIRAKGKLALPPQNSATVSSMSAGMIETIPVKPGDRVTAGQTLATIVSQEIIQIQHDFIAADNRCRLLEKEYNRQVELSREKITSDKKFQETEAAYNEVKGSREALRMRVQLLNIQPDGLLKGEIRHSASVVSPISGTVEHIEVNLGRYVEPNTVLFTVINKDRLNIELMVFEKDIPYVTPGQRVTFELANIGGEEYEARVVSIGRMVEEEARTVRVIGDFRNTSPYILPGMFVAAEIHTDEQDLDALPEEAIVTGPNNEVFCYYTLSDDKSPRLIFNKLLLKTGFREDGFVQVKALTTLPPGARIVTRGSYFIKAEGLRQQE